MFDGDAKLRGIAIGIDLLNLPDRLLRGFGAGWFADTFIPAKSLDVNIVAKVAVLSCIKEELRGNVFNVEQIERTATQYHD